MIATPPDQHHMLALFVTEGRELALRMDAELLLLEQSPTNLAAISSTFRSVHSLKGMCATLGMHALSELLHRSESLLEFARTAGALCGSDVRVLLGVADAVRTAIDLQERGVEVGAPSSALDDALNTALDAREGESRVAMPVHAERRETPLDHNATMAAMWRVDVTIAPDAPIPSARASVVLKRLAALAPVIRVVPNTDVTERDDWNRRFSVWLGSGSSGEVLESTARAAGEIAGCVVTRAVTTQQSAIAVPGTASSERTVRIPAARLDTLLDLVGELVLSRGRLGRSLGENPGDDLSRAFDETSRLITQLRDAILTSRLLPLAQVFDRFPRLVHDTAQALGKEVDLIFDGRDVEVDRSLIDELSAPLLHLLRNAVDHGLETPDERRAAGKPLRGRLVVRAARDGAMIAVTVADDGRGVDRGHVIARAEQHGVAQAAAMAQTDDGLLQLLALPGLSTATAVTTLSGRGVGVDTVLAQVQALGGRLELTTAAGAGAAFTIRVPLSIAMMRVLLVRVAHETYAIPLIAVASTHRAVDIVPGGARQVPDAVAINGEELTVSRLRQRLGLPILNDVSGHFVVLGGAMGRRALLVDACVTQLEVIVKPLPKVRGSAALFSGGTVLADGSPSLILDVNALL
jgi:two-component system, chemotaxis family, sensor kinase CheA